MRSDGSRIALGPLIAIAVLVAVLALGTLAGLSARRSPASHRELHAPDVLAAADMLRTSGAHGATLVLLDGASHNKRDIELAKVMHSLPSSSYAGLDVSGDAAVSALIYSGVVRDVWVVIPDAEWAEVAAASSTLPQNVGSASMPARRFDGALVRYTSLKDLPITDKPVLLLANAAELNGYDPQLLGRLRDPAVARITAIFGSGESK
jgi:hypothetical protein